MTDFSNAFDIEMKEDLRAIDELNLKQVQLKRKLELNDNHPNKIFRFENIPIRKEINTYRTEDQNSSFQSFSLNFLPDLVVIKILGYLSYHEMAKARMVCWNFNEICKRHLNRGYRSVQNYHKILQNQINEEFQALKDNQVIIVQHIEIKNAVFKIEASFFLLNVTFLKYIEANSCCFIPGKVIDYIYRVLRKIQNFKTLKAVLDVDFSLDLVLECQAIINFSMEAIKHFLSVILPLNRYHISPPRIFSSKTHFKPFILRSFIGSLTFEDILSFKILYDYFDEDRLKNNLNLLKEQFQFACFKEYNRLQLLEREIDAEMILGEVSLNNKIFYLIKWKGLNEADFFTYVEFSSKFPQLFQQYMAIKCDRTSRRKSCVF